MFSLYTASECYTHESVESHRINERSTTADCSFDILHSTSKSFAILHRDIAKQNFAAAPSKDKEEAMDTADYDDVIFPGMAVRILQLLTGHSLFWELVASKVAPVLELKQMQLAEQSTLLPAVETQFEATVGAALPERMKVPLPIL